MHLMNRTSNNPIVLEKNHFNIFIDADIGITVYQLLF